MSSGTMQVVRRDIPLVPIEPGTDTPRLGAASTPGRGTTFLTWAPNASRVDLHLVAPDEEIIPMEQSEHGYYFVEIPDLPEDACYFFRLDGERDRPDPASRFQPHGVHGPSQVIEPSRPADSAWTAPRLRDYIIYELHIGTFTPAGTFDACIASLNRLADPGDYRG